ncbi:hypothetical protein BH23PLA1_BH23PLA1_36500 [soil metagenome]
MFPDPDNRCDRTIMNENPPRTDAPNETRIEPSRHPITAWVLLAIFVPVGGWLLWKIEQGGGLAEPRLWELLRDDPFFGFAMLDFFLTAGWAAIVLIERQDLRSVRTWALLVVFCVVPTLGIILFLLLGRPRPATVLRPSDFDSGTL